MKTRDVDDKKVERQKRNRSIDTQQKRKVTKANTQIDMHLLVPHAMHLYNLMHSVTFFFYR